jgi:hypothetical protein
MSCELDPTEEAAFDQLVKRALADEWARFPAPGPRVWRALTVRLECKVNVGIGGNEATTSLDEDDQGNSGCAARDDDAGATPLIGNAERMDAWTNSVNAQCRASGVAHSRYDRQGRWR